MINSAPFFSIIIPAYNSEKTIQRAVYSIVRQNFHSYELIVIDDGSIEQTFAICTKMSTEFPEIKLFSKPNGGVSSARNYGLDKSSGEYIIFLDADDVMLQGSLNSIYEIIKKEKTPDLILCDVNANYLKNKNQNLVSTDIIKPQLENYDNSSAVKFSALLFSEKYASKKYGMDYAFMRMPVSKAYRRQTIVENNIRFDEKIYRFEDGFFNLHILLKAKSIVRTNLVAYDYVKTDSGSGKPRENIVAEDQYKINTIDNFLENQKNSELIYLKNFYYLELLCEQVIDLIRLNKTSSEIKNNLKQGIFRIKIRVNDLRYAKLNKILIYILFKLHCYNILISVLKLRLILKGGL